MIEYIAKETDCSYVPVGPCPSGTTDALVGIASGKRGGTIGGRPFEYHPFHMVKKDCCKDGWIAKMGARGPKVSGISDPYKHLEASIWNHGPNRGEPLVIARFCCPCNKDEAAK